MKQIISQIKETINRLIPIPEVFQFIDTEHFDLLFVGETQELHLKQYMNSVLPEYLIRNNGQLSSSGQFSKLDLIDDLLKVIWQERFHIIPRLNQFNKQVQQGLLQFLNKFNRVTSLQLIQQIYQSCKDQQMIDPNRVIVKWTDFKKTYLLYALCYALNQQSPIYELLNSLYYDDEKCQFSIYYTKKLKQYLQNLGLFNEIEKYEEIEEQELILNSLKLIINNREDSRDFIQIMALMKSIKYKQFSDPKSIEIINLVENQLKKLKDQNEQNVLADLIRAQISYIYLDYSIKSYIAIPEFLIFLGHQNVNFKNIFVLKPSQTLFQVFENYPELFELTEMIQPQEFLKASLSKKDLLFYQKKINQYFQQMKQKNNS